MMSFILPNSSQTLMLKYILNVLPGEDLNIRLFSNNITLDKDIEIDDFVELSGPGYHPNKLKAPLWTFNSNNPVQAMHPEVSWTFLDNIGNVYGYYVTTNDTNKLLWAETFFNGPYNITKNGDVIRITPRISIK